MTFLQEQSLILVQSLLGVISSNFRMVYISELNEKIIITIVLENLSVNDMEEIDDLKSEFEALQTCQIDFDIIVKISSIDLNWPDVSTIVVYRRKED
ncbi:hypothetical protein [Desulfomicrobium apsheronum]|uniref:hypothetical protein n=1 Tax=Desulfomicrobium apsheronum TaxID=52560 RepID=UPI000B8901F1|nr:hypothetical protein [Desulfomicrobium apsheronum]